jgi:hypothetical protein
LSRPTNCPEPVNPTTTIDTDPERFNNGTRQARPSAWKSAPRTPSAHCMRRCRFALSLVWIAFGCAAHAQGGWTIRESQTEPSIVPLVVHQHVVLSDSSLGSQATLDLAKFSAKSCRLHLIDNPAGSDLATAMSKAGYVAGVNGGYFDENFAPLGLRIRDNRPYSPLVRGRLLTGIITSSNETTRIIRSSEFARSSRPVTALQCGPFLIDRRQAVPGLDAKRPARRTFIATTGDQQVALGCCSDVSLAQLAAILVGWAGDSKIQRALNLDGGSSSAFWFKRKDGTVFSISEQKSVRDFFAIGPR